MYSEYSALRPKDSKTRSSRDGRDQSKHSATEKFRSASASTGNWKDLLDAVEADDVDLWDGLARHDRPVWKGWLEKAEHFSRLPKKPLPKDVVKMVLGGDIEAIDKTDIVNRKNEVTVFVSSTFTDTKAERNELMKDVYPYLRMLCQRLGLEFGTVDMRWGVTDDTIKEHGTANMCLQQIDRCLSSSVGPAFLCILGNKYGRTSIPTEIDREEFESLLDVLVDDQMDTSLLRQYFRLDLNDLSPKYVLKPTGVDGRWNEDHREMQKLLRLAAGRVLSDERSDKYFISVTEMEVHCGILNNGLRDDQVILLYRDLAEVTSQQHLHRHLVDMEGNQLDQNAVRWLNALREFKLANKLPEKNICKVRYEKANLPAVREYIKNVCDELCHRLTLSVLDCYKRLLHRQTDATFNEALHHLNVARDRTSTFVGRDDVLNAICSYLKATDDRPFVVHGESGCGKTALLAMAAKMAPSSVASSTASSRPAVVVRFIGTSSASSTVRSLLHSVCSQITYLYDGDVTEVPQSYGDLIEYFKFCLQTFASTEKPLVVILDSLDQLANENYAHNLHWLSLADALPANVRLILSTVSGRCLDVLNRFVPPANVLQVAPLPQSESREILDRIMSTAGRRLTSQQSDLILQAFESCAIPLYLRLAAGVAVTWRSYSEIGIDNISKDVSGLIAALFDRLEKLHGRLLTSHALAYITAASNGLSQTELEDVLSCDDDVLNEVYQYWIPPIRRIPPLLWLRIRHELASYLVERGSNGIVAYSWYHRQFKDVAEKRYLVEPAASEIDIRLALADYFDGKWISGKPYSDKDGNARPSADRRISRQPICLFGDRQSGRRLNTRMLRELPFQLLKLRDWKRFAAVCCRLEFVEARFEAEQGHDCLLEFEEAARLSDDDVIVVWCKFIRASFGRLLPQPIAIYQLAAQQALSSPVRKHLLEIDIPDCVTLMVDTRPTDVEDPCQMTLLGHTGYVACCCYSADGQLAASTGEDGALRVWNAVNGTCLCCVVDERLSGSVCRFSSDGRHLVTGTRNGQLLIWELTDMHLSQISAEDAHDQAITQIVCSPDGSKLAMSSLDGSVSIYSVPGYQLLGKVVVGGYAKGCDFSGNSQRLCVALNESTANMAIIDVETCEVTVRGQEMNTADSKDYITCCSFSPDDKLIVTSKNCVIIVWEAVLCRPVRRMTATNVVTCLAVLSNGSKLISGHRNGAVSAWDISSGTCIAAFRGHTSFVRHLALHPVNKKNFLTASGDRSLKVWDLEAVISGRVLPDTGQRCVDASVSPDRRFIVCRTSVFEYVIVCASTGQQVGDSFASSVPPAFTSDSKRLLSIAESSVSEMQVRFAPSWTLVTSVPLTLYCSSIACSHHFIVCSSSDDDGCELHLLDVNDYQPVRTLTLTFEGSPKTSVACSPISDDVAVGYCGGIRVVNLSESEAGQVDLTTKDDTDTEMETSHVLYTPDGRHLVGIREDGAISVWQTSKAATVGYSLTRSLLKIFDDELVPVAHAAVSPNSKLLLTVTEDHVLTLRNFTDRSTLSQWFGSFPCAYFVSDEAVDAVDANANVRHLEIVQKDANRLQ